MSGYHHGHSCLQEPEPFGLRSLKAHARSQSLTPNIYINKKKERISAFYRPGAAEALAAVALGAVPD